MSGIIANYIFAYGFITDISNQRYFEEADANPDMETVNIKKLWLKFLNEVGWFQSKHGVTPEEQSKLFIFGERILSVENKSFSYMDESPYHNGFYDVQEEVFNAKLKHTDFIDAEAELNNTYASYLFFMNDKL